jgi:hypothetical protein
MAKRSGTSSSSGSKKSGKRAVRSDAAGLPTEYATLFPLPTKLAPKRVVKSFCVTNSDGVAQKSAEGLSVRIKRAQGWSERVMSGIEKAFDRLTGR